MTDDGTVMSCGWNENGQLGLGHCEMLPGSCFFGPVMDVIPRLPVTKLVSCPHALPHPSLRCSSGPVLDVVPHAPARTLAASLQEIKPLLTLLA